MYVSFFTFQFARFSQDRPTATHIICNEPFRSRRPEGCAMSRTLVALNQMQN